MNSEEPPFAKQSSQSVFPSQLLGYRTEVLDSNKDGVTSYPITRTGNFMIYHSLLPRTWLIALRRVGFATKALR